MADHMQEQAALWLAREDRGLSDAEQAEMTGWLEAGTQNRVAYLRLKAAWRRADRLASHRSPMAPAPAHSRVRLLAAIAALLLLTAGAGGLVAWRLRLQNTYETAVGATRTVQLADGTRMELNTGTRLLAKVSDTARTVTLEEGEAYFDVVHDARRPFTVYAGNRRITDLGTKFSVYRNGDDVRVIVSQGRVKVAVLDGAGRPVEARAGHVVVAGGAETLVMARPMAQITDDLAWREGMLIFHQQTLGEVADQFNRYNSRHLVVEGDARNMRIGGSFKAANVDVFVHLLHRGFGLAVDDRGDRIIVSR